MSKNLTSERITVAGSAREVNDMFLKNGWSDGLPIIPPTEKAVAEMLTGTNQSADKVIAVVPPLWGEATVEKIAINAVMAGCLPAYLPIIIMAVEAMCQAPFNLNGLQTTTHPAAVLLIVNGPIVGKLDINGRVGVFGPGWRSNATIGRAIRLILMNLGGGYPGKTDMATQGQPSKYSFCIAENEDETPWEPLHVERGFPATASTVTVVAAEGPHNINEHCGISAEEILTTIAGTVAATGNNNIISQTGQPIIALSPEHAATIAGSGFSKDDVREFLHREAVVPRRRFHQRAIRQYFASMKEDALIPVTAMKEDIIVIVTGGPGKHSAFLPTFSDSRSITRAIPE